MAKEKREQGEGQGAAAANNVEVTVELHALDMRNARIYDLLLRRKWFAAMACFFLLIAVGVIVLDATNIFVISRFALISSLVLVFLIFAGLFYLLVISNTPTRTRQLTFTPLGVATPGGRDNRVVTVEWAKLYDIRETGKYLYLYLDASQFLIVPKRYLDEEELKHVREFIRAKVPYAKIKR